MTDVSKVILLLAQIFTIVSAVFVAVHPNILSAAIALLFTLCGVAVLFLFAGADFIAAAQIIIYAGGVVILTLFAIMLTQWLYKTRLRELRMRLLVPGILALAVFLLVYRGVIGLSQWLTSNPPQGLASFAHSPKTAAIGEALMGNYLLAFESVTILLLGALVGAVWLMRPKK